MRDFDPTASEFISSGYLQSSRPGGKLYDPGTLLVAGSAIVGSMMGADAAESAADTQAGAARDATAAQERMFERQVQLQEPWRQAGMSALNRLQYLTGLPPSGPSGTTGTGGTGGPSGTGGAPAIAGEAQIRARLAPQFTTTAPAWFSYSGESDTPLEHRGSQTVDSAGLDAAVQAELARQEQAQAAQAQAAQGAEAAATSDPAYGSLMHDFSMADFEADPGFQFRQEQGEQGLTRAAAAAGGLGSGKYLKDAMRFNQGLATDEFGRAYDRFNLNRDSRFNKLATMAGIGQTATNQTSAAAGAFGSQIGSNILAGGAARAAGQVGAANAINGGIGQGISLYQNNQLLKMLRRPGGGVNLGTATGADMDVFYGE
jgi:hypothetical protein